MGDDNNQLTLVLERGTAGLGFNIVGGIDTPKSPGDHGIYVSKIKHEGAAARDGRLQVGDKIIEVNGTNLVEVRHQEAVDAFINAGDNVTLIVIQPKRSQAGIVSKLLKVFIPAVFVGGLAVGVYFIVKRKSL